MSQRPGQAARAERHEGRLSGSRSWGALPPGPWPPPLTSGSMPRRCISSKKNMASPSLRAFMQANRPAGVGAAVLVSGHTTATKADGRREQVKK